MPSASITGGSGTNPLVQIGDLPFDVRKFLLAHLAEFASAYRRKPFKTNSCGILLHHAFALWSTVKALQPKVVIESGVNTGMSTYMIRQAAPNATIICIDPLDRPLCGFQGKRNKHSIKPVRWKPENLPHSRAHYLTGDAFVDFNNVDWIALAAELQLPEGWASEAVAFFDDHMSSYHRLPSCQRLGIRHVLFEDNYLPGAGDLKVRQSADSREWEGGIRGNANLGFGIKQLLARDDGDARAAMEMIEAYREFPPVAFWIGGKGRRRPKAIKRVEASIAICVERARVKWRLMSVLFASASEYFSFPWPIQESAGRFLDHRAAFPEPILRPGVCRGDLEVLKEIVRATGVGPAGCVTRGQCDWVDSWEWNNALEESCVRRNCTAVSEWYSYNFMCYLRLRGLQIGGAPETV